MKSLLQNALKKSCAHLVAQALPKQIRRLISAGYSQKLILEKLVSSFTVRQSNRPESVRTVVLPFYHRVSHNLKAVCNKQNVRVVFSNAYRLDRLTPFSKSCSDCGKNHRALSFVPCAKNVVYSIPLKCGFEYIGQTSQCINVRLGQHKTDADSTLSTHLRECRNCEPLWRETSIISREPVTRRRLLRETLAIQSSGHCVSEPSVVIHPSLKSFFFAR